jgi:hypothetical protein
MTACANLAKLFWLFQSVCYLVGGSDRGGGMAKESIGALPAETRRTSSEVAPRTEILANTKASWGMRRLSYLGLFVVSIVAWIGIIYLVVAWFHL